MDLSGQGAVAKAPAKTSEREADPLSPAACLTDAPEAECAPREMTARLCGCTEGRA